ncbi:hypothetical protein BDA96_06G042400 [Sorghum bicolor]|uniref:Uncharacterized protein n=2 Tax=Sorghum bicolor TaxID=4558 RepID=A0A921QNJ2_SORBI|nr:hypothetical protein BDA96_06G042400 [Sorghum bicolor]
MRCWATRTPARTLGPSQRHGSSLQTLNLDFSTALAQCSLFPQPYWAIWMELRL